MPKRTKIHPPRSPFLRKGEDNRSSRENAATVAPKLSSSPCKITIRPATPADAAFILSLLPHLVGCPLPRGRRRADVLRATRERIAAALAATPSRDALFLVATRGNGQRTGFVQLELQRDFFTGARACHVANLAVAPACEGHGIGTALLARARTWARARHCTLLTLNVFPGNARARALYARNGFDGEMLRMTRRVQHIRRERPAPAASVRGSTSSPRTESRDHRSH